MFPQLARADTEAAVRAADARVPGRKFLRRIATKEIRKANEPESLANVEHGGHMGWIVGDVAEAMNRREQIALEEKKKLFQEEDLARAFERYLHEREQKRERLEDLKWETVALLQRRLELPEHSGVRIAGGDRALYERMFKAEPRKFISRDRFMTTMWRVFGFEIAELEGMNDGEAVSTLNKLFSSFDKENLNRMDWRCFLMMLRMIQDCMGTPRDHLLWAFAMFGSAGSMDFQCSEPVSLEDVRDMVAIMGHAGSRGTLVEIVDRAWCEVCEADPTAAKLAKKTNDAGKTSGEIPVPFELFGKMLTTEASADLFDTATTYGLRDQSPWTYMIEERYYHPVLLTIAKTRRRDSRNNKKVIEFKLGRAVRHKQHTVGTWAEYCARRRRCRYIFVQMIVRYHVINISHAFAHWLHCTLDMSRARDFNRVVRGFLARCEAKFVRHMHTVVVLIQKRYRALVVRRMYQGMLLKRNWAALEMQRHIRGCRARRITLWKLQNKFDREMRKMRLDREKWQAQLENKAAGKIQTAWHGLLARRRAKEEKKRKARIAKVEKEMVDLEIENNRKRNIYEEKVVAWYAAQRDEFMKNALFEEFSAAERDKILKHRRRKADAERAAEEEHKKKVEQQMEEQRVENFLAHWDKKIEKGGKDWRAYLEHCIDEPETQEEKLTGKEIMKEVKAQGKIVFKRAAEQQHDIEKPEADRIARNEVLLGKVEEKKAELVQERKNAAAAYYQQKEEADAKAAADKEEQRDRDMYIAATMLQKEWIKFRARKELRTRCYAQFTKKYDPEASAYYYERKKNGERQWRKPFALGSYDIKVKNCWVVMHDSTDALYYYNPASMDMSWKCPPGVIMCDECKVKFCFRRCNSKMQFFCPTCYDEAHEDKTEEERDRLFWKEIEGGDPECFALDIEKLPNMPVRARKTSRAGRSGAGASKGLAKLKKATAGIASMAAMAKAGQSRAQARRQAELDAPTHLDNAQAQLKQIFEKVNDEAEAERRKRELRLAQPYEDGASYDGFYSTYGRFQGKDDDDDDDDSMLHIKGADESNAIEGADESNAIEGVDEQRSIEAPATSAGETADELTRAFALGLTRASLEAPPATTTDEVSLVLAQGANGVGSALAAVQDRPG